MAEFGGQCVNGCISLNWNSCIEPSKRAAIECFVTMQLMDGLKKTLAKIGKGNLLKSFVGKRINHSYIIPQYYLFYFLDMEMPIQKSLLAMERIGFAINKTSLSNVATDISELMKKLEQNIYQIHGKRINLGSSNEVANVNLMFISH